MRKIFSFLMLLAAANAHSQDVIVKKDGEAILTKVIEITPNEIKYKKYSNQEGPTYSLSLLDVMTVNYENGEKEEYGKIQESIDAESKSVTLKAGIGIPLQIVSPVKAADVKVGQSVAFKVNQEINVDGVTVIPYGTPVRGTVYKAKKSSGFGTKGKLGIRIDGITLPNGGSVPLNNGNVYVTGTNRTALSVVLFLFVTMPAAFICGSKAQIPVGYEIMANVAKDVVFNTQGSIIQSPTSQISFNNITFPCPATLSIEGRTFEAAIVSTEGDVVTYIDKTAKSDGKIQEVPKNKVRNIRYHK